MSKPGPAGKQRGRQGRAELAVVHVPAEGEFAEPPSPPKGLLKSTREWWAAFWESRLAAVIDPPSLPMVERLARYYDQWERAQRAVRKTPLVKGSMGQVVAHPLTAEIDRLEKRIRGLEKDLALPAYERSRLGLAQMQEQKSLADLTAELYADDDDDDGAADDPRAVVIDAQADAG